jgi:hypothetical protein
MDLLATLKSRIDALPKGNYLPGLRAVLLHIETAFAHLSRGQSTGEDTAFTDAIYRTNQAFEGSVKEAYRVLTGRNPDEERPYDIEQYLESQRVFRPRVLAQFKNYRTEWRNPSTHDYKLDFDESEAFLAIISVTAFGCLLLDQITERISFEATRSEIASMESISQPTEISGGDDLDRIGATILEFLNHTKVESSEVSRFIESEARIIGALSAYVTSALPSAKLVSQYVLPPYHLMLDAAIQLGDTKIALELKKTQRVSEAAVSSALATLDRYLQYGAFDFGVLLYLSADDFEYDSERVVLPVTKKNVLVIRPHA